MTYKKTSRNQQEPETLVFHREMYDRRLERLRQRGGLSEREIAVQVNNPSLFRRQRSGVEADCNPESAETEDQPATV